ncbi:MAG: HAD hydrolase family protein [Bacteroidota bacterium]
MTFFARNLSFLRQQSKEKPEAFASSLGIWERSLRQYEQGREEPDLQTLMTIAQQLNLPVDHLLGKDLEGQQARIRRQKVKLVLLDVDGTMTDGGMYYSENGDQLKKFNTKDGMAIKRTMKHHPVKFGFISSASTEGIISSRAKTLGIELVYAGGRDKTQVIEGWLAQYNFSWKQIAYVGDDLNDLVVMEKVGISACPSDAVEQVKLASDVILKRPGGKACVREFLEEVLEFKML